MRSQPYLAAAIVLAGFWLFPRAGALADDDALLASLPDGPGKEETFYTCHSCHSFRLVAQQRMPRKKWDELLDWMIEEQGMADIESDERSLILDYLSVHYGF